MLHVSPLLKYQRWRDTPRRLEILKDIGPDEIKRLAQQTGQMSARIYRAFADAVDSASADVDLEQIAELLRQNRVSDAIHAIGRQDLVDAFTPVGSAVTGATLDSGVAAAAAMAEQPALGELNIVFSHTNPATVDYLRSYEMNLIQNLSDSALGSVRTAIRTGVEAGRNPLDIARDVRDFIGLTERQTQAVTNYRRMLENLDSDALARELRDRRFDPTIDRAITNEVDLSPDQVDRMVERYGQRMLKYRSETIARTEAMRAVNFGNREAWKQQVTAGKIAQTDIVRDWIYTHDGRARESHVLIPIMNPDGVGLDEPFETIYGSLMYPGDPLGEPEDTINCFSGDVVPTFVSPVNRLMRRYYCGPLIDFSLEGGSRVSVTPNHPMLSPFGWQPAGQFNKGDDFIYCPQIERLSRPKPDATPANFAQMFDLAAVMFTSKRMVGKAPDFHGDGFDGNVDIISETRELRYWVEAACAQKFQNLGFSLSNLVEKSLSLSSPSGDNLVGIDLTAPLVMRRTREFASLLRAGSGHAAVHALRAVRHWYSVLAQASSDLRPLKLEFCGDSLYAHAAFKFGDYGRVVQNMFAAWPIAAASYHHAGPLQLERPVSLATTKSRTQFGQGMPIAIERKRIIDVVRYDEWSGHVFNSETEGGLYLANGIIARNCRCAVFTRYRPKAA